jgi:hypothetical protein
MRSVEARAMAEIALGLQKRAQAESNVRTLVGWARRLESNQEEATGVESDGLARLEPCVIERQYERDRKHVHSAPDAEAVTSLQAIHAGGTILLAEPLQRLPRPLIPQIDRCLARNLQSHRDFPALTLCSFYTSRQSCNCVLIHSLPTPSAAVRYTQGRIYNQGIYKIPFLAPWKKNLTTATCRPAITTISPPSISEKLKMRFSVLLTVLKLRFSRVRKYFWFLEIVDSCADSLRMLSSRTVVCSGEEPCLEGMAARGASFST